jgi:hypothetical protein
MSTHPRPWCAAALPPTWPKTADEARALVDALNATERDAHTRQAAQRAARLNTARGAPPARSGFSASAFWQRPGTAR